MVRRLLVLFVGVVLVAGLVGSPAQAHGGRDVYSEGPFNDPYSFTDDGCDGLTFEVTGRSEGYETLYNVPGSDGQAFLQDLRYRYREVWTNPANGRKAFVSGRAHNREVKATQVEGNVWTFVSVLKGKPFVVKNDQGRTVLAEWGRLVLSSNFDTLGDGEPGGELVSQEVVSTRGNWPTWDDDFDFCRLVRRVLS